MFVPPVPLRLSPLGVRDRALLIEAALMLTVASLVIALVPFRRIAKWASALTIAPRPAQDLAKVGRAGKAIEAWGRRLPWKTVCFQKGLALHWMLQRRDIASLLHYGVDRHAEQGLRAHVWISVNGDIVMGGEIAHEFACLAVFPPADASAIR